MLWLAIWFAPAVAAAQEARSLRGFYPAALDELDFPRVRQRQSHRGFEIHSDHFVVVSPRTPLEAEELALRCEAAWKVLGRLADPWTSEHHDPRFGLSAVSVMVVESDQPLGPQPVWSPNDSAEIYVDGRWLEESRHAPESTTVPARALEQAAALEFFEVARWEARMPRWIQAGLAAFVADELTRPLSDPFAAPATAAEPPAASRTESGVKVLVRGEAQSASARGLPTPARVPGDGVIALLPSLRSPEAVTPAEDASLPSPAVLVRYLLEAEDGRHAPELLRLWAASSSGPNRTDRNPKPAPGDPAMVEPAALLQAVPEFFAQKVWRQRIARWQADRWRDQPLLVSDDLPSGQWADPARQLVLVWKLADRFAPVAHEGRSMRVTEFEGRRQVERPVESRPVEQPVPLVELVERLRSPGDEPWATIDPRGRLLWSTEADWLSALAQEVVADRLTSGWEEGHPTLSLTLADGRQLTSWVDDLPSAEDRSAAVSGRPRIRFRVREAPLAAAPRTMVREPAAP